MAVHTTSDAVRVEGVTVVRDDRNELVARKATTSPDTSRLVRELAILRRLDGLGVTRPCDPSEDGRRGTVDLHYVGPRTLAEATDLSPGRLVQVLAAVAATLDAAHGRGVSHGRLEPSHVLLGPDDSVVVCGWSAAGLDTEAAAFVAGITGQEPSPNRRDVAPIVGAAEAAPQGPEVASTFDAPGDVAALGELAYAAAQQNRSTGGRTRTQLTAVATAARHPDPAVRPPMAELARVLALSADTMPASGVATASGRTARPTRRLLIGGAVAALAAALTAAIWSSSSTDEAAPSRSTAEQTAPSPASLDTLDPTDTTRTTETAPTTDTTGTTETTETVPATTAAGPAPVDPDALGCPATAEELALAGLPTACAARAEVTGELIRIGSAAYALGDQGDRAALVDPGCTGRLTPAVLQVASGRVYVYDQWAVGGPAVSGRLIGVAPGAVAWPATPSLSCSPISLLDAEDHRIELTTAVPA